MKIKAVLLYRLMLGNILLHVEALLEAIDATACIDELLLSGKERMALGANFNTDILLGGAGLDNITASAGNGSLAIVRMDLFLHLIHLFHIYTYVIRHVNGLIIHQRFLKCKPFFHFISNHHYGRLR